MVKVKTFMSNRALLIQSIFNNNVNPFYDDLTDGEMSDLLQKDRRQRHDLMVFMRNQLYFSSYTLDLDERLTEEQAANDSFYDLVGLVSQALGGEQLTVAQVRRIVADALPDYVFGWKRYRMDEVYAHGGDAAKVKELESMSLSQFQAYVQTPRHGVLSATVHILSSYFNVHFMLTARVEAEDAVVVLPQPFTGALGDNFVVIEQRPGPGTLRSYDKLSFLKLSGREYAVLSPDTCAPQICAFLTQRQPPYKNAYKTGPPV